MKAITLNKKQKKDIKEIESLSKHLTFDPSKQIFSVRLSEKPKFNSQVYNIKKKKLEVFECYTEGIKSTIIKNNSSNKKNIFNLITPVEIQSLFEFSESGTIYIEKKPSMNSKFRIEHSKLNFFEGIIFDLDGTLVELPVDWEKVGEKIKSIFGSRLDKSLKKHNNRSLNKLARTHGLYDEIQKLLEFHETKAAEEAIPLETINFINSYQCPIGICTANAKEAAIIALDKFNVLESIDFIVGRESLKEDKPHPRPLFKCLKNLEINPGNSIFIGDKKTDAKTAFRAGTSFFRFNQLY